MMTTNTKGGSTSSSQLATTSQQEKVENIECCMCGDFGLSTELFRCKICRFRSQHRYCSNLFPKAESYSACNWCLKHEKEDTSEKTQNSLLNSSSSNRSSSSGSDRQENDAIKSKKKAFNNNKNGSKGIEKGSLKVNTNSHSVKKQKPSPPSPPERSPLLAARKRITTSSLVPGITKESLWRTKSDMPIKKHVLRNKVRRYKLLDEFST